ncbi:thiamine pyrophosphate-binding protein [Actinocrispum wychmicini]|uniref:Acetolactate synthase-1/2/3 large subunit n=1 Tax=Actinocrispum wychmicini TaxID=1213861 RepID=A0A4V2S4P1_9PSEU|nr:thiamine pyrophosphate-binding protein [Actinocrispum wychmicini]TCO49000.1 acetolactate synthase-1/2/3 large subunit [Actinocrispum wychmicini]
MRTGGDLVVESLTSLGARTVFGLPGQHALGMFDALRRSSLRYIGNRLEVNAAFAADGHARVTGDVTPLLVSTGPGALQTLAGLQEAASASVPVVGISSQIPVAGLGGARRGFLHELPDQRASFRDVVKHTRVVRAASQIPSALAEAWEIAASAPTGPVWLEIPQDVLLGPAGVPSPEVSWSPRELPPRPELVAEAARLLSEAARPMILAGGGVVRGGGADALLELAEKLDSPVATTFGGKGAFPWHHRLSLQSWLEDGSMTAYLESADVLLVVGSGLGELSSNYHRFRPTGHVIQVDADLGKLEANHPALGIHADAALTLPALVAAVSTRDSSVDVSDLLRAVRERVAEFGLEQEVLAAVRNALPAGTPSFWDMTILAYWAWSAWDGPMHSAQGAGGLGYAFPAALGAASTVDGPVLAVSGDGGAMYGLAELATARQHNLPVTWLIVDDGGYGILRGYMADPFGTELARPDFVALASAFDVPATRTTPDRLRADLATALTEPGPHVVVLPARLRMFEPSHA